MLLFTENSLATPYGQGSLNLVGSESQKYFTSGGQHARWGADTTPIPECKRPRPNFLKVSFVCNDVIKMAVNSRGRSVNHICFLAVIYLKYSVIFTTVEV